MASVDIGYSIFAGFDRDGDSRLDFEEFVSMQPRRIRQKHTIAQMVRACGLPHTAPLALKVS